MASKKEAVIVSGLGALDKPAGDLITWLDQRLAPLEREAAVG